MPRRPDSESKSDFDHQNTSDTTSKQLDTALNGKRITTLNTTANWVEISKLVPQIGWVILAGLVIYGLHGPIVQLLQQNSISKLGVGVLQIEFAQKQIREAAIGRSQEIPAPLRQRIERAAETFRGASILWIDDNPSKNLSERRALTSLGITVDTATSSAEALKILESAQYSVLISDEIRDESNKAPCYAADDKFQPANAGCYLMRQVKTSFDNKNLKAPPFIIYGEFVDPNWGTPVYAFGATSRVDELFHLILDSLERSSAGK